jgi:thiol:disulfide interchange protein DsbD
MIETAGVSAAFIWLAATAGALSLLTPCVFPMVPITVSYFLKHADTSRARAFAAVAVFGLGIIVTFTALGVSVAALVGAASLMRFAANAWVNLAIAAIFLALALNLLGFYELRVSSRVLGSIDSATRTGRMSGTTSALLMGVLFTLTSFTCTAPFIGTLLVAASQGEWQRPIVGMLVYAVVFALPFIVLATIPRWISRLPRSGAWLNRIKVVMGFVELAAVAKFISNADLVWHWDIFTHDVVLGIWVALALIVTFYLLGAFRLPHEPPEAPTPKVSPGRDRGGRHMLPHITVARGIPALAFLTFGMWLATGLTGGTLGTLESFLPPVGGAPPAVSSMDVPAELQWRLNDLPAALALARQQNRRVFIDFTGYTCTNCRWMEANMFTRPEIKVAMNQFVLARLYTDGDGDIYEKQQIMQQQRFGTIALPLYAIVDPDGRTVETFAGLTRSPNAFLSFLSSGLD